jgi:multidrug resistance efflux pump
VSEAEPSYPPETHRYMSWSALQFIHRPTWRPLAWVSAGLVGVVLLAALLFPLVKVDLRAPAAGEIAADPGALSALAAIDGRMDFPKISPGTAVKKGEVLGLLELDLPEPRVLELIARLDRNIAELDRADREALNKLALENGAAAEDLHDASIRELSMSLQLAARGFATALKRNESYDALRTEVMQSSARLKGALSEFLERHRVRAPAPGILLQYQVPPRGALKAGEAVAVILPEKARLVTVLALEPRNAAKVAVGQTVRHNLEAYPFQQYGLFEGEVLSIEQTADPLKGLLYQVKASIRPAPYLPKRLSSDIQLMMGMKAESKIVVGKRRLLDEALEAFFNR